MARRSLGVPSPDFYDDALCPETDPEVFYPERGGSVREAVAVCGRCSVREKCLDWALENDERWGVWGGTSEQQRAKARRARNASARAAS